MSTYTFAVNIGDWSQDGHNQYERVIIESSHKVAVVQDAFIGLATKIGIFTSKNGYPEFLLCTDYEDSSIDVETLRNITEHGVDLTRVLSFEDFNIVKDFDIDKDYENVEFDSQMMAQLLMEIAKADLPGFTYKIVNDKIPNFNGFWDTKLNMSVGYGLFYV